MIWLALANSFTIDWWARKIVSTTLNFFLLEEIPLAHIKRDSDVGEKLIECVRELTIRPTIPIEKNEMRTIRERAYLRARIDVEVAKYYKLTLEELLFLLNDFESLNERETVVELIQLVWNGAEETDTKIVKLLVKEKMPYVPQELAKIITEKVRVPTIGIGAGQCCDGQIQVFHDLVGFFDIRVPKHAKKYINN
ncbi:MAG TPA: hypothetical protein EYQ58_03005, partial [Candidatus Poseidoniales archaeon]|nr:hypothetical protein [Candidatus Poseidoniales archaeon]